MPWHSYEFAAIIGGKLFTQNVVISGNLLTQNAAMTSLYLSELLFAPLQRASNL